MNVVLSASKLMTAAEVKKQCKEWRENPAWLLDQEFEVKSRMFGVSEKEAG